MSKEYMIKNDGWNKEAFDDVVSVLNSIHRIQYEIECCVRTCTPTQMVKCLKEHQEELGEVIDYL